MIPINSYDLEKYEICIEITDIRKNLKLSQKDFGQLFGIPQTNISMWENFKAAPPKYVVTMIRKIIELKTKGDQMHIENCWECIELREKREGNL